MYKRGEIVMKKSFQYLLIGSGVVIGALILVIKHKRGK